MVPVNRAEIVKQAAKQWREDLTDESGRNRLLYYRELKTGTLDLGTAEPNAVGRLQDGKKVQLSQLFSRSVANPPSVPENPHQSTHSPQTPSKPGDALAQAVRRARAISRKAQENFEEKGIQTLFLGWGMATWVSQTSKSKPDAPVLLCPVSLQRQGVAETDYDLQLAGEWTLNEALLQHLANEYKVDVSGEDLMDPYGDGEKISPDEEQAIFAELAKRAQKVPNFAITERLIAGNFMYKKMPMVTDIQENLDALANNDLIAALAGDTQATEAVRSHSKQPVSDSWPDQTAPAEEYLILSADSSQSAAINAALLGHSFVLQGPPGTGKSQTISNLIAAMMAHGKRVLFVAEKRAAIEAVIKRLEAVGLSRFVMDLHGGVPSRKKLAQQFDASLTDISKIPLVDHQETHKSLREAREELSGYADALHQVREPWGLSYYEVLSQLLLIENQSSPTDTRPSPAIRFAASALADLDEATTQQVRRDLRDYLDLSEPVRLERSLWASAVVTSSDEARNALQACRDLASAGIADWQAAQEDLAAEFGLAHLTSVADWAECLDDLSELTSIFQQVTQSLPVDIFSTNLAQLLEHLAPLTGNGLTRMSKKLFSSSYKSALSELENLKPGLSKRSPNELLADLQAAQELASRWKSLSFSGLPRPAANNPKAQEAFAGIKRSVDTLAAMFVERNLADLCATEISELAQELLEDSKTLFQLPHLYEVEQRLRGAHVGPLLDDIANGTLPLDEVVSAFDHSRLRCIQEEVLLSDQRLSGFQGSRQSRYVQEFQRTDAAHITGNPNRVSRLIAEHAVQTLSRYPHQDSLIRREAQKKRRHLPLRGLFDQAPDALAAIRPCWAMSPLDVAQTLPPHPIFDLVVFDEASQVLPCDAISAILRARRAMVAGDSRQLPPTTFFDSSGDGDDLDEDEESLGDYESILDVMDARLSRRLLTWHYRSQDERLIAYSNQEIYHGMLTTFPGADSDKCLSWEFVPHKMGVTTEKGSNSDEVLKVVELMIAHAQQRPQETLGVIAMGMHHANRIEEVLRQQLQEANDPNLESFFSEANEERAFVKNLERVQGDERDAIILSIGYGKNAEGRMRYNFGPLNREGGERRLNVAITRARKRMTLVTSFTYGDLDPEKTRSEGAKMLRGFVKFAQSGGAELDGADAAEPLNAFEVDILDKLTAAGLDVITQYGCSGYRIDFAVRHPTRPDQFALAVEADGASYHSSPTARDRDRLRQEHLERLGWRFCRIWSTDWFNDHRTEVDRVLAAYKQALHEIDSGQAAPVDAAAASNHDVPAEPETPEQVSHAQPPRIPPPPMPQAPSSIDDYTQQHLVALGRWIESDNLLRTDAQLFDAMFDQLPFNRRGSKITKALDQAIATLRPNR